MSSNENSGAAGYENVWLDANRYYDAERRHYEVTLARLAADVRKRANPGTPPKPSVPNGVKQSSLASEIANARQKIQNFLKSGDTGMEFSQPSYASRLEKYEKDMTSMRNMVDQLRSDLDRVLTRLSTIEKKVDIKVPNLVAIQNGTSDGDDDDLDLFDSDVESDKKFQDEKKKDAEREKVLQSYANKKAKKPALVAKSSVVLDVKPWDDETDMKAMEKAVREIQTEGLLWGASKLVPLAYGINKLQIVAIVEDEKVSIDWLQETISENEDLVQSVDIAAFNKL